MYMWAEHEKFEQSENGKKNTICCTAITTVQYIHQQDAGSSWSVAYIYIWHKNCIPITPRIWSWLRAVATTGSSIRPPDGQVLLEGRSDHCHDQSISCSPYQLTFARSRGLFFSSRNALAPLRSCLAALWHILGILRPSSIWLVDFTRKSPIDIFSALSCILSGFWKSSTVSGQCWPGVPSWVIFSHIAEISSTARISIIITWWPNYDVPFKDEDDLASL